MILTRSADIDNILSCVTKKLGKKELGVIKETKLRLTNIGNRPKQRSNNTLLF